MKEPMNPNSSALKFCMAHVKRMLLLLFLMVFFLAESGWASECEWCKRTVVVKAFSLTEPSFTTEAVSAWLAPLLSSSCVTVKPFGADPKPEYFLYARFEASQTGSFPYLDGTYGSSPFPGIHSRLNIVIYNARGVIQEQISSMLGEGLEVARYGHCEVVIWGTEDKGLSWQIHQSLMLEKIKNALPLEKILRAWENAPTKAEIKPQKEELDPGEEIDIRLTDFRDKDGKPMETNCNSNRILVKAEKGEILNNWGISVGTEEDPKSVAIPVTGLSQKFEDVIKYKAPNDSCTEDTISVYNSCDILHYWEFKVLPMEQTRKKDLIGKKKIRIGCKKWKGSLVYKKSADWERDNSDSDNVIRDKLHHTESALLNVQFRYSHTYKTREYYKLESMTGIYELDHKFKRNLKPKNPKRGPGGTWTDTAECSGPLNKDQVSVTLVVDLKEKKYSLSVGINSPVCTDKMVVSGNPEGDIVMTGTNNQKINANLPSEEDRSTDGRVIADFLKIPQPDGKLDWSWNLSFKP